MRWLRRKILGFEVVCKDNGFIHPSLLRKKTHSLLFYDYFMKILKDDNTTLRINVTSVSWLLVKTRENQIMTNI